MFYLFNFFSLDGIGAYLPSVCWAHCFQQKYHTRTFIFSKCFIHISRRANRTRLWLCEQYELGRREYSAIPVVCATISWKYINKVNYHNYYIVSYYILRCMYGKGIRNTCICLIVSTYELFKGYTQTAFSILAPITTGSLTYLHRFSFICFVYFIKLQVDKKCPCYKDLQ